jgi:hypothetical protein
MMSTMKLRILEQCGSMKEFADQLNVEPPTVKFWHDVKPRNMLKYAPEVVKILDITYDELIEMVLTRHMHIMVTENVERD